MADDRLTPAAARLPLSTHVERGPGGEARVSAQRLHQLVEALAGQCVLVLGDIVADERLVGRPASIAREAPVVVLHEIERSILPGGATNVAANAAALGARVAVCGVIGADAPGAALSQHLESRGIDTSGLVVDAARPTTTKTRIWAGGAQQQVQQLLLRIDRVDRQPVGGAVLADLLARLRDGLRPAKALLISDYENGVIHPDVIAEGLSLAQQRGMTVVADSHGDLTRFRGASALTPNQPEVEATLGRVISSPDELDRAGAELLTRVAAEAVLMTRGREGMSLYVPDDGPLHLPAIHQGEVADPTGAGDTVAAVCALAVAAGATWPEAAVLANLAAGIVVAKIGTATVSAAELAAAVEQLPRA